MSRFDEIIASKTPTLVDVFATWCGPCKMMHPILEDVKRRLGDVVTIIKIDVDQSEAFATQYDIRSVPTLMVFKEGALVWRESGVHSADDLVNAVKRFV